MNTVQALRDKAFFGMPQVVLVFTSDVMCDCLEVSACWGYQKVRERKECLYDIGQTASQRTIPFFPWHPHIPQQVVLTSPLTASIGTEVGKMTFVVGNPYQRRRAIAFNESADPSVAHHNHLWTYRTKKFVNCKTTFESMHSQSSLLMDSRRDGKKWNTASESRSYLNPSIKHHVLARTWKPTGCGVQRWQLTTWLREMASCFWICWNLSSRTPLLRGNPSPSISLIPASSWVGSNPDLLVLKHFSDLIVVILFRCLFGVFFCPW